VAGLFGCVLLASSLPLPAVAGGAALVVAGGAVHHWRNGRRAAVTGSAARAPRAERNDGSGSP